MNPCNQLIRLIRDSETSRHRAVIKPTQIWPAEHGEIVIVEQVGATNFQRNVWLRKGVAHEAIKRLVRRHCVVHKEGLP